MSTPSDHFLLNDPYISVYEQDTPSIIMTIREGIGFDAFSRMLSWSPFSLQEWSRILHLTERSLQRYKKENKTFDTLQSEKIMQILLLYKKGIQVFGTKENFDTWLDTVIPALGHIRPKEILDSSFGIDMIKDELLRIEHGVLA